MLKKLNQFRRKALAIFTKNLGQSHLKKRLKDKDIQPIKRVLICRPNQRLGNMLLTTPLIQEINRLFPDCRIDIVVKGTVAKSVFKSYNSIDNIIILPRKPFKEFLKYIKVFSSFKWRRYDLAVNAVKYSSSGRILTAITNSHYKVYGFQNDGLANNLCYQHTALQVIYELRQYLSKVGFKLTEQDVPLLEIKLESEEIRKGKVLLGTFIKDKSKPVIALFTYATGSKCYSKNWWQAFYKKLTEEFGDKFNIIEIIPIEKISQFEFQIPFLYSKDIREMAGVFANCEIFIGADSGVMHLASSAGTTTIGLFKSREMQYRPYGNTNVAFNTENENIDILIQLVQQKSI